MSELSKKIVGIALGVRFSRSFRIPDMSGEIIDNILRDSRSPFDTEFFPNYRESSTREKILLNKNGDSIKITPDDFIFSLKINEDFEKKYVFTKEKFIEYVIYLFDQFAIEDISRVGILFYCNLSNSSKFSEAIKTITNQNIQSIKSFDLTFARKVKTEEGLLKKGVKDYINIIYSLSRNEDDESIEFKYDYQKYFLPTVTKLKDTKLEYHFEKSFKSFESEYAKWIKDYDTN